MKNKNFNHFVFLFILIGLIGSLLIKNNITYIIILSLILILFLIYTYIENKKLKQIDKYLNDILNNRDTFDIREYSEDYISSLKNDIYKITMLLKEGKEKEEKEKKELEIILSDISHQIKTPLTSMYVINDLLLDSSLNENKKKEFLNKNRTQLERIEWLVTSLLKLSRIDNGTIKLKKEEIDTKIIINKVIEPLKIPIELKKQTLIINDNNFKINVDLNWTVEALINILKNAYEHTKENGIIEISTTTNPLYTQISIKDNGEGIDSNDIKHIFERFYRGNSNKESIGIGLHMSKKIIEHENGNIEVESKKNIGTTFNIKFYKIK